MIRVYIIVSKKKFEDSFIPNLEDLNNFLKNCTIKEIKSEDIQNEIDKLPKEKVFDPDEFIKENYENKENKNNVTFKINFFMVLIIFNFLFIYYLSSLAHHP